MNRFGWKIVDSGIATAEQNMVLDAHLLKDLDAGSATPVLHLYDWEFPSATFGHFINPYDFLSFQAFSVLDIAKRPTGGGLLLHTSDWAFSILVPAGHEAFSVNTLENYTFVNQLVIKAIEHCVGRSAVLSLLPDESKARDRHSGHFCMAKPTKYDVMLEGKKVGGGAQRRTRAGYLHQGTISLALPDRAFLERVLIPGTCVADAMFENTCALLPQMDHTKLKDARRSLQESFFAIL